MKLYTTTGKPIDLRPPLMGQGGEAWVYKFKLDGVAYAAKILKGPDAPDFRGDDEKQVRNREGAKERLEVFHHKIGDFPQLPSQVVAPIGLLTTKAGKPKGLYMPVVDEPRDTFKTMTSADYRTGGGDPNEIIETICNLGDLMSQIHTTLLCNNCMSSGTGSKCTKCGGKLVPTVIGDFNDLNILGPKPYLIDADSMQFGKYPCRTFTERFVDPTHCVSGESKR